MYHNVLSEPANGLPAAANQVTLDAFRQHVGRMRKRLLHPLDVHRDLLRGKIPQGVLITFDDGAAGVLKAAQVLAEAGSAAVAFICPGALNGGIWFYRLADALVRTISAQLNWRELSFPLVSPEHKRQAYAVLSRLLFDLPPSVRDGYLAEIVSAVEPTEGIPHPSLTTLDEAGLREAAETGGVIFANHSWSHPNLAKLSTSDLKWEIDEARRWLETSGLPVLPWFAYPRSIHDARVREAVSEFYPISFGENDPEGCLAALPRVGIYRKDSNLFRFTLKTVLKGRLRRLLH